MHRNVIGKSHVENGENDRLISFYQIIRLHRVVFFSFEILDKSIFPVRQPPPAPTAQEEAACAC